jgi:hypothetical protein
MIGKMAIITGFSLDPKPEEYYWYQHTSTEKYQS